MSTSEPMFALTQLSAVLPGLPIHTIRDTQNLRLTLVAPTPIAAAPFMVSQIEALGIPFGNAELSAAFIVVPADEVQGVLHGGAATEDTTGLILIFLPCLIFSLGIAFCRRLGSEWNEQEPIPWGSRVVAKRRLLFDEGHENVWWGAPFFLGFFSRIVPLGVLVEYCAQILLMPGGH